jgi:hypothetical protein
MQDRAQELKAGQTESETERNGHDSEALAIRRVLTQNDELIRQSCIKKACNHALECIRECAHLYYLIQAWEREMDALPTVKVSSGILTLFDLKSNRDEALPPKLSAELTLTRLVRGPICGWHGQTHANAHAAAVAIVDTILAVIKWELRTRSDDLELLKRVWRERSKYFRGSAECPEASKEITWLQDQLRANKRSVCSSLLTGPIPRSRLESEIRWEADLALSGWIQGLLSSETIPAALAEIHNAPSTVTRELVGIECSSPPLQKAEVGGNSQVARKRKLESEPSLGADDDQSDGSEASQRSRIPPENRTRPMTLREAARLMGYARTRNSKKAVVTLRNAMDDGLVPHEKINRQCYVFDRNKFPSEVWSKLTPTDPN